MRARTLKETIVTEESSDHESVSHIIKFRWTQYRILLTSQFKYVTLSKHDFRILQIARNVTVLTISCQWKMVVKVIVF